MNDAKNPIRTLITTMAATALIGGAALAQDPGTDGDAAAGNAGSADAASAAAARSQADAGTTATFYSDLPANGGEIVGEANVDALDQLDGQLGDARYAVVNVGDRSYAFPVQAAGMAEGEVRVGVRGAAPEGGSDAEANAAAAGSARLGAVADTLEAGVTGEEDVLIAARPEGDAHVVTHIAPRDDLTDASTIDATEDHVVVALDDGESSILDVESEASNFGELDVTTDDGAANVLDDALWEGDVDANGDANAAADANEAAGEGAETDDGLDVGIGMDLGGD